VSILQYLPRQKEELVSLCSLPGINRRTLRDMLTVFGSPVEAWERVTKGDFDVLPAGFADKWHRSALRTDPRALMEDLRRKKIGTLARGEEGYPPLLEKIHDPPWLIFYRGVPFPVGSVGIALVGSRKATAYGIDVAEWISSELAGRGINIISGAAFGIDAAAHRGALGGGGSTTAVLGTGVDVAYPRANSNLIEEISRHGCVMSE